MIRGIDISAYQPVVDQQAVRDAGAEFEIVKVTDGNSYTNPHAKAQVLGAFAVGLLVTLYHFAQPNGKIGDLESWKADARAEAKRFDDLADAFERELGVKLFCFLDVERNTALTAEEKPYWRAWCNEFRRWSREVGKRIIGFYSGKYFTMDLGFDLSWSQTILWVAQYPRPYRADANYGYWPKTIVPWFRGDIWQDGAGQSVATGGNDATWPGVGKPPHLSDVNVFAGSRAELEELIAAAA